MLKEVYLKILDGEINLNKSLSFVVVAQTVVVIFLIIAFVSFQRDDKTIIFPVGFTQQRDIWITDKAASEGYLESMAEGLIQKTLNISADNKTYSIDAMLFMVPNDFRRSVETELKKQIDYLVKNGLSQTFYPFSYDYKTPGQILVMGKLKQTINEKVVKDEPADYYIYYKIEHGRFWLTGLKLASQNQNANSDIPNPEDDKK